MRPVVACVAVCLSLLAAAPTLSFAQPSQPSLMEPLGRGVVALRSTTTDVVIGWRVLGTDPPDVSFQVMVYDLDGDGRSEVACKTADGTIDGVGTVIGDGAADWRNANGFILQGPEFLTIFNGQTGAALATAGYIVPRGDAGLWGDNNGNRVDRFLAAIAYLDGQRPSLVVVIRRVNADPSYRVAVPF